MICEKSKVLFVIQYQFNVSVNSPLASINTNCTLLASSSSLTVKVTASTTQYLQCKQMLHQVRQTYAKTLYTMN